MKNRRKGLGIVFIMAVGMFASCNDFWDSINEPKEPTIIVNSTVTVNTNVSVSTLKCVGANILDIAVKTDSSLIAVSIDADTTKIAREVINEVHCTLGTENHTFTEVPIVLKDTLAESGSYTLKIVAKYIVDDSVAETTYSGSLTVTSETTNSESNF